VTGMALAFINLQSCLHRHVSLSTKGRFDEALVDNVRIDNDSEPTEGLYSRIDTKINVRHGTLLRPETLLTGNMSHFSRFVSNFSARLN